MTGFMRPKGAPDCPACRDAAEIARLRAEDAVRAMLAQAQDENRWPVVALEQEE